MVVGFHDGSYRDFMLVEACNRAGYATFDRLGAAGKLGEIERSVLSEEEISLKRRGVGSVQNYASPGLALTSLDEYYRCVKKLKSAGYITIGPDEAEERKRGGGIIKGDAQNN